MEGSSSSGSGILTVHEASNAARKMLIECFLKMFTLEIPRKKYRSHGNVDRANLWSKYRRPVHTLNRNLTLNPDLALFLLLTEKKRDED
jgi:hypothetical protein